MLNDKIILAGLANNKTSLGEVFRRYIKCFQTFSTPDVYDLSSYINNDKFHIDFFPPYRGLSNHDLKYFHTTFHMYRELKARTNSIPKQNAKKIGFFVWESSLLHDRDVACLKDFDQIWTASQYCKDIFSQYIDTKNIHVVPHPIVPLVKSVDKYPNFTILIICNISSNTDRKNILGNIKVAKEIRKKNKKVRIILKTFTVSEYERMLLRKIVGKTKIEIIDEYYTSDQVQNLIAKSHVILSLHRSEGFGLTLAESMAYGTMPIATNYSGNIDFMNEDNSFLVSYDMIDVNVPYFKGQWADPHIDDAIDQVQYYIDNWTSLSVLINNGKKHIEDHNSMDIVAARMQSLLI